MPGRFLQPIEQFEGWIGAAGLVWGLLLLLRWLSALGMMYSSGAMLVTLLTALVMIALSLIIVAARCCVRCSAAVIS